MTASRICLTAAGIGARRYYTVPIHRQPAMAEFVPSRPLPGVEEAAAQSLALPMGPSLTPEQVAEVTQAARDALDAARGG